VLCAFNQFFLSSSTSMSAASLFASSVFVSSFAAKFIIIKIIIVDKTKNKYDLLSLKKQINTILRSSAAVFSSSFGVVSSFGFSSVGLASS
jgi:hypothetical protein